MTDTQETPKMTLAEAFGLVQVSASSAITVLNSLAEAATDKDPALSTAINEAITALASGKSTAEAEITTSY